MKSKAILFENKNHIRGLVSFILCIHEDNSNIFNCLNSIHNQTYNEIEYIIIIDSKESYLYHKVDNYCNKYFKKKFKIIFNKSNLGLPKSLNLAIKKSKGEYIARIDSDDICITNRIKIQVDFLKKYKNITVVGSEAYIKNFNRKITVTSGSLKIKKKLKYNNPIIHPSVLIRRELFNEFKYDENFRYCQDYKLWVDISDSKLIENINIPLIFYNVTKDQISMKRMKFFIKIYLFIFFKYKNPLTILGLINHLFIIFKKKIYNV